MLSPDETHQLLQAGSARAFVDAAAFVRRSVCPDGSADGEDGDFSDPDQQWAALTGWVGSCGKILPLEFPAPEREGGREHDVTLHELSGLWIKYTKPSASGYTVSWREDGVRFEGFDIWDVHPANVLLSPDGLPLPIDVIVTRSPA